MDIDKIFDEGGYRIPNPNYDKRKKKNNDEPPTILSSNPNVVGNSLASGIYGSTSDFWLMGDTKKYQDYGVSPRPGIDLDKELADKQSGWAKIFNSVGQTVVSEIGLGTVKGFTDLLGFLGEKIGLIDSNYNNVLSQGVAKAQDWFNEDVMPIHSDPNLNIDNGGLGDVGWWAKNIPSIASSLTLLFPARSVTAGLGKLGKAVGAGEKLSKARRFLTGMGKIQKAKELESISDLNRVQKFLNSDKFLTTANAAGKVTTEALLMRTMENYQEAGDVHKQTYDNAINKFANMTDEDYNNWVETNQALLEGVDTTNKEQVAKAIARKAADKTFGMDFANTIFDVIQLWSLGNLGNKVPKITKGKVKASQRKSIEDLKGLKKPGTKVAENTAEAAKEVAKKPSIIGKFFKTAKNTAKDYGLIALEESTEGIEEAVNYVAQQEGITYGKMLLEGNTHGEKGFLQNATDVWLHPYDTFKNYMDAPELWESAFWGVMGGVVFNAGGSALNRHQAKAKRKALRAELKEKGYNVPDEDSNDFIDLLDMPEVKAAKTVIGGRTQEWENLLSNLDLITQGYDIFGQPNSDQSYKKFEGTDEAIEVKQAEAKDERIRQFRDKLAADAIASGTFDLLVDYFRSEPMKEAMIELGLANQSNVDTYVAETINDLNEVRDVYYEQATLARDMATVINASGNFEMNIPTQYINMIAKANTDAIINSRVVDRQLARLDKQTAEEEQRILNSLTDEDEKRDYQQKMAQAKASTKAHVLIDIYSRLEADKNYIKENVESSLEQKLAIDQIESNQRGIVTQLRKLDAGNAAVLSAIKMAQYYEKVITSDASGNESIKYQGKSNPEFFAKSDEDIIKEYEKLINNTGKAFTKEDIESISIQSSKLDADVKDNAKVDSLTNQFPTLFEHYANRTVLEYKKYNSLSNVAVTKDQFLTKLDSIHTSLNEAREKAIQKADKTFRELFNKYKEQNAEGIEEALYEAAMNNNPVESRKILETFMTDPNDVETFMSALDVFKFSHATNAGIARDIMSVIESQKEYDRKRRESSTKNENNDTDTQNNSTDDSSSTNMQNTTSDDGSQNSDTDNNNNADSTTEPLSVSDAIDAIDNPEASTATTDTTDSQNPSTDSSSTDNSSNADVTTDSNNQQEESVNIKQGATPIEVHAVFDDDVSSFLDVFSFLDPNKPSGGRSIPIHILETEDSRYVLDVNDPNIQAIGGYFAGTTALRFILDPDKLDYRDPDVGWKFIELPEFEKDESTGRYNLVKKGVLQIVRLDDTEANPQDSSTGGQDIEQTNNNNAAENKTDNNTNEETSTPVEDSNISSDDTTPDQYKKDKTTTYRSAAEEHRGTHKTVTVGHGLKLGGKDIQKYNILYDENNPISVQDLLDEAFSIVVQEHNNRNIKPFPYNFDFTDLNSVLRATLDPWLRVNEELEDFISYYVVKKQLEYGYAQAISEYTIKQGINTSILSVLHSLYTDKKISREDVFAPELDEEEFESLVLDKLHELIGQSDSINSLWLDEFRKIVDMRSKFSNLLGINQAGASLAMASKLLDPVTIKFSTAFKLSAKAFLDEYKKLVTLPVVDGKQVIKLADILQLCNNAFGDTVDTTTAQAMYNVVKNYLLTDIFAKNEYILVDINDVNSNNVLPNINASSTKRHNNHKFVAPIRAMMREVWDYVNDPNFGDDARKEFLDAYNSLQEGDTLEFVSLEGSPFLTAAGVNADKLMNTRVGLAKNGQIIGFYPKTNFSPFGEPYYVTRGWVARFDNQGHSPLRDLFVRLLTSDEDSAKQFRDILYYYHVSKESGAFDTDKNIRTVVWNKFLNNKIIKQVIDNSKGENNYQNLIYSSKGKPQLDIELLDHLDELLNYAQDINITTDPAANKQAVIDNIDSWFTTINDELIAGADLNTHPTATISLITGGVMVPNVKASGTGSVTYNDCVPVQEALAASTTANISFAEAANSIVIAGKGIMTYNENAYSPLSTFLTVYNENGTPTHTALFPITAVDQAYEDNKFVKGMMSAALTHLNGVFQGKNFVDIEKTIKNIIHINNSLRATAYSPTALLRGANGGAFYIKNGPNNSIQIDFTNRNTGEKESFIIQLWTNKAGIEQIGYFVRALTIDSTTNNKSWVEKEKGFSDSIGQAFANFIKPKVMMNVSFDAIRRDNIPGSTQLNGWITRINDKVVVNVPGTSTSMVYDSYSDFVIKNNLVRVNLKKSQNGTNFEKFSETDTPLNNIYISLHNSNNITSTSSTSSTDTSSNDYVHLDDDSPEVVNRMNNIRQVVNSNKTNPIEDIVKLVFDTDEQNTFAEVLNRNGNISDFFPNIIDYDNLLNGFRKKNNSDKREWIGAVAWARGTLDGRYRRTYTEELENQNEAKRPTVPKGHVVVGAYWLNAISSNYKGVRNAAIQTLIHENIHNKFAARPKDVREKIINELYNIYKKANDWILDHKLAKDLDKYGITEEDVNYFAKALNIYTKKEKLGEELLAESLTSKSVYNILNAITSVGTTDNKKESLFDKILNFVRELFGWDKVRDDSLLQRELNILRDLLDTNINLDNSTPVKNNQNVDSSTSSDKKTDDNTSDEPKQSDDANKSDYESNEPSSDDNESDDEYDPDADAAENDDSDDDYDDVENDDASPSMILPIDYSMNDNSNIPDKNGFVRITDANHTKNKLPLESKIAYQQAMEEGIYEIKC